MIECIVQPQSLIEVPLRERHVRGDRVMYLAQIWVEWNLGWVGFLDL
jgi:hypothetical protein